MEQTKDSYLRPMKLHKEGRKVIAKEAEEEDEEEGSPLRKELHTKQRRDPTLLKATNSKPTMGMSRLVFHHPLLLVHIMLCLFPSLMIH